MSGSCAFTSDTMPDYYCVTVAGVTNGSCADCANENKSWLLTQSSDCTYDGILFDVCSGSNLGQVKLLFDSDGIELAFYPLRRRKPLR